MFNIMKSESIKKYQCFTINDPMIKDNNIIPNTIINIIAVFLLIFIFDFDR